MKSASRTQSSMLLTKRRRSSEAPGARPCRSSAGQALARRLRSAASAPGAGSQAITSRPWARARAIQPAPITPVPRAAKVLLSVTTVISGSLYVARMQSGKISPANPRISSGLRERETNPLPIAGRPCPSPLNGRGEKAVLAAFELHLLAALGRGQGAAAEALDDLDGAFHQLTVAGMHTAIQPDVVLQP